MIEISLFVIYPYETYQYGSLYEPTSIIIPHVNFQQSDWSNGKVAILNATWQCHTACVSDHITLKFVVEMGHSV